MRRLIHAGFLFLCIFCLLTSAVFAEESSEENAAPRKIETWVVAKDGRGDFETVQAAIDAAGDYDTIRITPGTYEECLKAVGKCINLVGDDPYSCIIRCPGFDYHNPALEMACGTLKNLTLRTYNNGEASADGTYGYCLHTDFNQQIGGDLYCENCHFISECGACAGIGLRPHFTLEFNNCTFDSRNAQGAIFCHDFEVDEGNAGIDMAGQRLVLRDCVLKDSPDSPAVIRFQSQELSEAAAEVTFQRNIVVNTGGGQALAMFLFEGRNIGGGHFLGSTDWVLTDVSALNSDASMNAF